MNSTDRLSLLSLLSLRGRLRRRSFWLAIVVLAAAFALAFACIEALLGRGATLVLYPPAAWLVLVICVRRYHDLGRSGGWLWLLVVPLLGPMVVGFELFLRGGRRADNRFGADPRRVVHDYHAVS